MSKSLYAPISLGKDGIREQRPDSFRPWYRAMISANPEEAFHQFTTAVGLITTLGQKGPNVMAAEWTFNVSYKPFLIAVCVSPQDATHGMIDESGEFGVNIVSEDQVDIMGFAGHFSKRETDKLSSVQFETYSAKVIRAPLIKGCMLNAECRVVKRVDLGDHTAFVGEVVAFSVDTSKRPVVLHRGARSLGPRIERSASMLVAATPMDATPGATIRVDGGLIGSDRCAARIQVQLLDPGGKTIAKEAVETDADGWFNANISLPPNARDGEYVVFASRDDVQGKARLSVRKRSS